MTFAIGAVAVVRIMAKWTKLLNMVLLDCENVAADL